ncbi:proton-coupled folate transporter isoform X2 [Nematostella vectensis]|uniref:proton-coupled folate transporter isoform X2 n=1 Tax=Nematostella vectensis TaxID=45351 RepID=UPI002077198A|nr:proton-coupled folate transporter isoform X2 [Nematostella vectensis]
MVNFQKLKWRTPEIVVFLYAYGLFMHVPVIQQYVYSRIAKSKGFPYDAHKKTGCGNITILNATMQHIEQEVQSLASYVHLGIVMFAALPSVVMSLLIGSWTDSRGRRPALFLPALGSTLESIVVILVMYFEWPIYVLFVGASLNGLCGSFTTIIMGTMAYIADTTHEDQRSLRLAILEFMVFFGAMVSQLTSGLWIEKYSFIIPYWFILSCLSLSCILVIAIVPESRPPDVIQNKTAFCSCRSLQNVYKVYMTPREGGRRNLFLLTLSSGVTNLILQGVAGVIVLFVLHTPLCFSPKLVGYLSALRYLSIGVGAVLGIKVLGRWLSVINISRVGMLSTMASYILFGFSTKIFIVFLVPFAGLFMGCVVPILRGIMSRIVSQDEQGALFSAVASLEMLCHLCGTFLFNSLYPASLKFHFPGFVFFLGAIITWIPFILIWLPTAGAS